MSALYFKCLRFLTGALPGEVIKTLSSFSALFLLLSSYYMVKPLRNSQFLKAFHADWLPFFFLFTAGVSIVVTKIFSAYYGKVKIFPLIVSTYCVMMLCKVLFHFYLPVGGKFAVVLFYIWASVYFLLAIAVLWGCINYIFSSAEGERCYGFIAIGGMLGGIMGSFVSGQFSKGVLNNFALLFSAAVMASVLVFVYLAMRYNRTPPPQNKGALPSEKKPKAGLFSDFGDLWGHRYVRSIAVMMYSIAAFNTVLEFQSQKLIDRQVAQQVYLTVFQGLNAALNTGTAEADRQQSESDESVNPVGFDFVFGLKSADENTHAELWAQFVRAQGLSFSPEKLMQKYQNFTEQKERDIRALFSNIFFYQGILGVSLLFFVSRFIFRRLGVRFAIMILPSFYLIVIVSLFFPLSVLTLEVFLVVGYGLNYSLNRATKELLYTRTSGSTIFRLKPLIDGPVRRLGDVTMAIFKLALTVVFVKMLGGPDVRADQIFFATSLLILGFWIYSVWYVGGQYDKQKANEQKESPQA